MQKSMLSLSGVRGEWAVAAQAADLRLLPIGLESVKV